MTEPNASLSPSCTPVRRSTVLPAAVPVVVAGIDLGDRLSEVCVYSRGAILERFQFAMTREGVRQAFEGKPYDRIAMEAGAQSLWVTHEMRELGFEPVVANPRKLKAISANERKSDRNDALLLAKLAAADASLLHPIQHRSAERAQALGVLKSRAAVVTMRVQVINTLRSLAKSAGFRFKACTAEGFVRQSGTEPASLTPACAPLFAMLEHLNASVVEFDKTLERMAETEFPETKHLLQVHGVGPVTALAFVLTIEDPSRFTSARMAAAFLGLVPRRDQSGTSDKQLGISKTGNRFLRQLLVQCAQFILGPLGRDCDLRRWGHKLFERGGKNFKKRAVVAVARKLAVLLFHLWKSEATWNPLHNAELASAQPGPTPEVERHPETIVPDDCAGPPDVELRLARRAVDCSIDGGSDPSMHRVDGDPSPSADRSMDTGMAPRPAPKAGKATRGPTSREAPVNPPAKTSAKVVSAKPAPRRARQPARSHCQGEAPVTTAPTQAQGERRDQNPKKKRARV